MNCERVREQLPDYLAGELHEPALGAVESHLETCGGCREEVALWEKLGSLPTGRPGPALRERFDAVLRAYEEGLAEGKSGQRSWRPLRPAFSLTFGLAAAGLIVGLGVGHLLTKPAGERNQNPEIAQLRDEVHNMRQMVALSLLQQQSASERLRGVNWSYRVATPDQEVSTALLRTLNTDPSVDVRLAAIDALHKAGRDPAVRAGLIESLARQDSPMVEIALIDLLVELRERNATQVFQQMRDDASANRVVRERAVWALEKLR